MAEAYIKVDHNTHVVTFVHKRPFDPVNGMGLSREELSKTGFFVEDYPEPSAKIGKRAVPYYDHEKKQVYYEYEPTPFTTKSRIDMLEEATNDFVMMMSDFMDLLLSPYSVTSNDSSPIALMSAKPVTTKPIVKVPGVNSPMVIGDEVEDEEKTVINPTSSTNSAVSKGLAKYLASQIYQGRLDKQSVLKSYPTLADEIEKQLDDWDNAH